MISAILGGVAITAIVASLIVVSEILLKYTKLTHDQVLSLFLLMNFISFTTLNIVLGA